MESSLSTHSLTFSILVHLGFPLTLTLNWNKSVIDLYFVLKMDKDIELCNTKMRTP